MLCSRCMQTCKALRAPLPKLLIIACAGPPSPDCALDQEPPVVIPPSAEFTLLSLCLYPISTLSVLLLAMIYLTSSRSLALSQWLGLTFAHGSCAHA
eukprot:4338646-Pleurochrysis_carterae.AAC.1